MHSGYVPVRRGILEHLEQGRLSPVQVAAYVVMILKADRKTGMWRGSAEALVAICGNQITPRAARHALAKLESGGYIKRFLAPGKRGNYPILINRFECKIACSDGAVRTRRVNADATTDWREPVYVAGSERATIQEERSNNLEYSSSLDGGLAFAGEVLRITRQQDRALRKAFPQLDVDAHFLRMDAWLVAHPEKHYRQFARFANSWLARERQPATSNDSPGLPLAEIPF